MGYPNYHRSYASPVILLFLGVACESFKQYKKNLANEEEHNRDRRRCRPLCRICVVDLCVQLQRRNAGSVPLKKKRKHKSIQKAQARWAVVFSSQHNLISAFKIGAFELEILFFFPRVYAFVLRLFRHAWLRILAVQVITSHAMRILCWTSSPPLKPSLRNHSLRASTPIAWSGLSVTI